MQNSKLNIAAIKEISYVNGPGKRYVIWLQGCEKRCKGCINNSFQEIKDATWMDVTAVLSHISSLATNNRLDGVTISGGEPLLQPESLFDLIIGTHEIGLDVLIFTGLKWEEINEKQKAVWEASDFIISGEYEHEKSIHELNLVSSSNQSVWVKDKTKRYLLDEISTSFEVTIHEDGSLIITGFPPKEFLELF